MWIPADETEIQSVCALGAIEETVLFDAKRDIPSKSIDLAKDVAAFANTAGGTILFGIEEDDSGRPVVPSPIELKGQRERIDSIIRTSVAEVPDYTIQAIHSENDAGKGYVILIIPPSWRAPHMVVVKNDRRYYGRGETGNFILSESEVARLYERRERSKESILQILREKISQCPAKDHNGFAHLRIVIRPTLRGNDLLTKGNIYDQTASEYLNHLANEARVSANFTAQFHPDFEIGTWKQQPDGYVNEMWKSIPGNHDMHTLTVEVGHDGSGYLFCSRAAETPQRGNSSKLFIADIVAGLSLRLLSFFSRLYDNAGYHGMVDIALGLTGIEGAIDSQMHGQEFASTYRHNRSEYLKAVQISAMSLSADSVRMAKELTMPIIGTISQGRNDPFRKLRPAS